MVYIIYIANGVVGFVSSELELVKRFLEKTMCYKVEIWKGEHHRGGYYCQ